MPDTISSFNVGSYQGGILPAIPAVVAQTALPGAAPALGLGLNVITVIVAGDVTINSQFSNMSIQRR